MCFEFNMNPKIRNSDEDLDMEAAASYRQW